MAPQDKAPSDGGKAAPTPTHEITQQATPETTAPAVDNGKAIEGAYKTPESRKAFNEEFFTSISDKLKQFTEGFRKNFCDSKGQPDLRKIFGIFGLEGLYDSTSKPATATANPAETTPATTAPTTKPADAVPSSVPSSAPTEAPSSSPFGNSGVTFDSGKSQPVSKPSEGATLPERPSNAPGGKKFMAEMKKRFGSDYANPANQRKMEEYIMGEIARGNVPSFCRPENGKEITIHSYKKDKNGNVIRDNNRQPIIDPTKPSVTYRTACDYVAIGSDKDYIRVPLTPLAIRSLDKYGWRIPTATITEQTYAHADKKLPGIGLVNTEADTKYMEGNGFIDNHNTKIDGQLSYEEKNRLAAGQYLVAGHKKDIIISRYAIDHPRSLDFRGLYINGRPIQTNPAHEDTYRDYSHGYRPIYDKVVIRNPDGTSQTMSYYEALQNPQTATVLNGAEGAIDARKGYDRQKINENQLPYSNPPSQPTMVS